MYGVQYVVRVPTTQQYKGVPSLDKLISFIVPSLSIVMVHYGGGGILRSRVTRKVQQDHKPCRRSLDSALVEH